MANISNWPPEQVTALRRVLKHEPLVSPSEISSIERSLPHGHVEALLEMIRLIGLDKMIAARQTRERDLVLAALRMAAKRCWQDLPTDRLIDP